MKRELDFEVERERENPDLFWLIIAGLVVVYVGFSYLIPVLREGFRHEEGFDVLLWMVSEALRWGEMHISRSWLGEVLGLFLYFTPLGVILGNLLFVLGVLLTFGRADFTGRAKAYAFSVFLGVFFVWIVSILLFIWLLQRVFGGRNAEETLANIIKAIR